MLFKETNKKERDDRQPTGGERIELNLPEWIESITEKAEMKGFLINIHRERRIL